MGRGLVWALRERITYLGYWILGCGAGHDPEFMSAACVAGPGYEFLPDVGSGADKQSVVSGVHYEEFTWYLVDEVNEARKLARLAPLEVVEITTSGPEAVD